MISYGLYKIALENIERIEKTGKDFYNCYENSKAIVKKYEEENKPTEQENIVKFFKTRQQARDFAKANNTKVIDCGTDKAIGERWVVEVKEPSVVTLVKKTLSIVTQTTRKHWFSKQNNKPVQVITKTKRTVEIR